MLQTSTHYVQRPKSKAALVLAAIFRWFTFGTKPKKNETILQTVHPYWKPHSAPKRSPPSARVKAGASSLAQAKLQCFAKVW